jgi:hypothetical protein
VLDLVEEASIGLIEHLRRTQPPPPPTEGLGPGARTRRGRADLVKWRPTRSPRVSPWIGPRCRRWPRHRSGRRRGSTRLARRVVPRGPRTAVPEPARARAARPACAAGSTAHGAGLGRVEVAAEVARASRKCPGSRGGGLMARLAGGSGGRVSRVGSGGRPPAARVSLLGWGGPVWAGGRGGPPPPLASRRTLVRRGPSLRCGSCRGASARGPFC